MINKNLTISKTILFNFVKINLQKCFYPGGGNGKKVGEEITKKVMEKCIGIGCNSTRPFMPPVNEKITSLNTPKSNLEETQGKETTKGSASEKSNNFSEKEMAKPIVSVGDDVKKNHIENIEKSKKDNSSSTELSERLENKTTSDIQENPNIRAAIDTAIKASLGINPTDIDESTDIFVVPNNIPLPPPPPPVLPSPIDKDKGVLAAPPVSKIFSEELQDVVKDRENRTLDTQELEKQNSLKTYIAQEKVVLKQQEKLLLEEYELLKVKKKDSNTVEEFKTFFKKLKAYEENCHSIVQPGITRDDIEYIRFFPDGYEPIENAQIAAKKFLAKKTIVTCYTNEQSRQEFSRKKEGFMLIKMYGSSLQEALFFEVLRRLDIVKNNDAIFNGDDVYGKQIYIEGEGFTLKTDVYKFISKELSSLTMQEDVLLEQSHFDEIFDNINKGIFRVHTFKYGLHNIDPNSAKLLESSDEIHMNITTTFTDNSGNKILVSVGHFTSNTDSSTVKISDKQYINKDLGYEKKEQRFRPYTQIVLVPMDKVMEYPEATLFCSQTNLEGNNIQQRLITAIKNNESILRGNSVRKYHNFTRENLQKIVENFAQKDLKDFEEQLLKSENKMKSLSETEQQKRKIKQESQKKNIEKEQKKNQVLKTFSSEYKEMRKDVEDKSKKWKD